MITEIPDYTHKTDTQGWILYDGDCRLCCSLASRCREFLHKHRFELTPLQTPWVTEKYTVPQSEWLAEMRFLTREGALYGGPEAVVEILRRIWWLWPLYLIAQLPGGKSPLRVAYRFIARH